jgi:hypothetical protein
LTNIIELFYNAMYNQNLLQSKIFQESREKNINLPTGLLTADDGGLFLKYCPDKRIKLYHTIACDSSCRSNVILRIRVKVIIFFKIANNCRHAEVLVNGKNRLADVLNVLLL